MLPSSTCQVVYLKQMDYAAAWELQRRLATARSQQEIPDTLLLLEHPPTYTLGSSGHQENILLTSAQLAERGIVVHRVDRGGDVTYHGLGQLVGYPILQLPTYSDGLHADVIDYIRHLEEVIIRVLAHYSIEGWRYTGYTGVWTGDDDTPAKIAAIGVKVNSRRVTQHGLALNVNTNMDDFAGIIPCGIRGKAVTSMEHCLGRTLDLSEVMEHTARVFGEVFTCEMVWTTSKSVGVNS